MKKTLLFLLCAVSFYLLSGCVAGGATIEQEKSLQHVSDFNGMKKTDLFKKSVSWAARSFSSSNDAIQLKDEEAGQIVCKGIGRINTFLTGYACFDYTMIIDVKDGKLRTRFESLSSHSYPDHPGANFATSYAEISRELRLIREDLYSSIVNAKKDDNW